LVRFQTTEQELQMTYLHLRLHKMEICVIPRLWSLDTDPLPVSQLYGTHSRAIMVQMTARMFGLLV
jgi:hypothetical protein